MKKILFKNFPNTETPLNAQNLNQMQTNIENAITGDIVKLSLQTDNVQLRSTSDLYSTIIPLESKYNIGSKFTVSNNSIVVGSGVSYVKVSAQCTFDSVSANGIYGIIIQKNGQLIIENYESRESNESCTANIPVSIIDVSQGDVLSLHFYIGSRGVILNLRQHEQSTFLNVEAV